MRLIVISLVLCATLASGVLAVGQNPNAKVAVHVLSHATRSCQKNFPVINQCGDINTTYRETNVDFFPVFFDIQEGLGLEFGVTWVGSTCTYTSCSLLAIGTIQNPGNGVAHAWGDCQTGYALIPGFGWIYSYGFIEIIDDPEFHHVVIVDCQDPRGVDTIPPDRRGRAYAGTDPDSVGSNPCELSVEPATWGQIKALFR